ncbi:hypothetical protein [Streptomyces lonarensis]|uniref:Uncharacterized protein n=1 Tax=Streptomyces lonarensis TaxID=700599 RepID=A0A7X6CX79_9ACTN|nr:hypothetical protein [Streptomyces lonarensis]NJQ04254.1 hypothetical protein [Streptomyces lonarensis]
MTDLTPAEAALLRLAVDRLRQPVSPDAPALVAPALLEPLAAWLEGAADHVDVLCRVAAGYWPGDAVAAGGFVTRSLDGRALDMARAILAPAAGPERPSGGPGAVPGGSAIRGRDGPSAPA